MDFMSKRGAGEGEHLQVWGCVCKKGAALNEGLDNFYICVWRIIGMKLFTVNVGKQLIDNHSSKMITECFF